MVNRQKGQTVNQLKIHFKGCAGLFEFRKGDQADIKTRVKINPGLPWVNSHLNSFILNVQNFPEKNWLPVCLPACLPVCLPTCLPACLA